MLDQTGLNETDRLLVQYEALVALLITKGTFTAAELQTAIDNVDPEQVLRRNANRLDHQVRL